MGGEFRRLTNTHPSTCLVQSGLDRTRMACIMPPVDSSGMGFVVTGRVSSTGLTVTSKALQSGLHSTQGCPSSKQHSEFAKTLAVLCMTYV